MATTTASARVTPRPATRRHSGHSVEARVAQLRELAHEDPVLVRDQAWQWFSEAGERLVTDRQAAMSELGALFATGRPSTGIDGETEGALVGWVAAPVVDRLLRLVTDRWLPWAGKRFDSAAGTGDNVLLASTKPIARAVWPVYRLRPFGKRFTGFDFTTSIQRGALDPELDVLVIDYASVRSNPWLFIKQIRDELVEVIPGAHLGKMILEGPGDRHALLAYFALKSAT